MKTAPMKAPALSLAAWLGASLLAGACGDDEAVPETPDAAAPQPDAEPAPDALTLTFAARIDGEPFACGQSYAGLGAAGADYVAADFRFYVHDVVVTTAGGDVPVSLDAGPFQDAAGGVALLDFEDASSSCQAGSAATHTAVVGTVPAGTVVTGVRFKVGVPFALNHLDATTAAPPLNVPAMYWAWASGYKFVRIDGVVGGAGFNLHLGTTGCGTTGSTPPTEPCASPNVFEVSLPGFDPAAEIVVADVAPVLADVDLAVNTPSTAPGCMSFPGDPECTTILPKLGLPYGEAPAGDQRLFTAATP
jgi:uncharacterized repeat protein (TIGR04052 family)